MEKRKLDLLMLSSDSDLWNLPQTPLSSSSSLCFLFFRLLRRSLALFELSLDVPEDDSEVGPPLPLYSPLSMAAAAATCWPIRTQTQLSWRPGACLKGSHRPERRREAGSWEQPRQCTEPNKPQTPSKNGRLNVFKQTKTCLNCCISNRTWVKDELTSFFFSFTQKVEHFCSYMLSNINRITVWKWQHQRLRISYIFPRGSQNEFLPCV